MKKFWLSISRYVIIHKPILIWAIVGALTVLIEYFVFIFLYQVSTSVIFANLLAGIFGITFNYLSHYFWSFKSSSKHSNSLPKFLINYISFWTLGTLLIKFFIESGYSPSTAKIIPMIIIAPASYFVLKKVVFKIT